MALNSWLQTYQILTNNDQMFILYLSYSFITTVKSFSKYQIFFWSVDFIDLAQTLLVTWGIVNKGTKQIGLWKDLNMLFFWHDNSILVCESYFIFGKIKQKLPTANNFTSSLSRKNRFRRNHRPLERKKTLFLTIPACFEIPIIFSNYNSI